MDLRAEQDLTQEELAERAGTSPTTISNLESGKIKNPHYRTLRRVATALGVGVEELTAPKVLSPQPEHKAAAGEPIDYREMYFALGRRGFALIDEALKNAEESLGTEDYDEFIELPVDEQHRRIEWAERWRKMAEEILASIEDERAELAIKQRDELARRREALASTIETFRKTA